MSDPRPAATRRAILAGVAGSALPAVLGTGRASRPRDVVRPTVASPSSSSAASTTEGFDPVGQLPVDGLHEAVVDGSGTTVYCATRDGFAVVDVADPSRPRLLSERRGLLADHEAGPMTEIWDLSVSGDRLVVGGPATHLRDAFEGFALFDVSDPARPERTAVYEADHAIHNLFLHDDVAYLTGGAREGAPVAFVDVRVDDPVEFGAWSPSEYAGWTARTCHDVLVADDVLYAAYWDLGTWLVDVSEPTEPDARLRVGHDRDADAGTSRNELPGNAHYARPRPDGAVLAVGKEAFEDEETAVDGAPGGIELWDVSDPATASREAVVAPPPRDAAGETGTAHNFGWRGDRLYTSWRDGGVRVFDASDPAAPRLLARWRDGDRADFWTAQPIRDGFVGASRGYFVDGEPRGAALLALPEPSGDGEPARLMEPLALPASTSYLPEPDRFWFRQEPETESEVATAEPGPETGRGTRTTGPARTAGARTATRTPGGSTSRTPGRSSDGSSSPSRVPGFGVLAAVVGGGLAAWRSVAGGGVTGE